MKLISYLTTIGLCHGDKKQNFADPLQKKVLNQLSGNGLKDTYGEYTRVIYKILVPANKWTFCKYKYRLFEKGDYNKAVEKCENNGGTLPVPLSGKLRTN